MQKRVVFAALLLTMFLISIPPTRIKADETAAEKEGYVRIETTRAVYLINQVIANSYNNQTLSGFINDVDERFGKKFSYAEGIAKEIATKTEFANNIAICLGATPSTKEELQKAINRIFREILTYRNGDRIEGAFIESDLESRIRNLEEGLEKVNNLVEEVVEWLTGLPPERGESNDKNLPQVSCIYVVCFLLSVSVSQ
jgi:uncharacterized protein YicC (UPF0701 family)